MRQLLSVLFILLTITAISLANRRSYDGPYHTNDFEKNFDELSDVGAASLDSGPTIITFRDPNNSTCGIGQFRFECLPDGYTQFDLDIPINLTIEVQQRLKIRDVFIWFGAQGTQPSTDYTNWGNPSIPSGGVSYAFHNLRGFIYRTQITLRDIISILTNTDGSFRTCFRIEVVVKVDRYCGFSNRPRAFRQSPDGCDFDYQAIYPANDAYFHVALNNDGTVEVNNDTLYFKGYCLDPTRSVYPNYNYKGQIYSSYDLKVLNSAPGEFVEAPQNFPYVNYIANHENEYLSRFLSGHQCTWQDVQNAVWRILFPNTSASHEELRHLLSNSTEDCVQWIVDDAFTNGKDYLPVCPGGKYLMIIFPILPNAGCNCTKDLETQLVAFPTGGSCLNKCAPKVCHDVIRAGRKVCLTGNCGPLPSPSVSITSRPFIPSDTSSPTISVTSVPSISSTPAPSVSSTPAPSVSSTPAPSVSSTPAPSVSSTPAPSVSSTPAPSVSSTPAPSVSSTPAPSVSSTPAPSVSSTPAPSVSGTPAPSDSRTPRPSRSQSSTPCPSRSNSRSSTSAPSQSSTPCPSRSSTPAPSDSKTTRPSRSQSSTPCPSRSSTPAPSDSKTTRPSRSQSSTPCPSRSATSAPSESRTSRPSRSSTSAPSISSKPILPSASSTPCPSRSPSSSAPCHASQSSRPSRSATESPECHMSSASPSKSAPCHQPSPSPSPCDKNDRPGKGHGGRP